MSKGIGSQDGAKSAGALLKNALARRTAGQALKVEWMRIELTTS